MQILEIDRETGCMREKVFPACVRWLRSSSTVLEDIALHEMRNKSAEHMIAGQDSMDRIITLM